MYKTEICRDFMRNRCLFADDCRHIHPGENDSKTRTKPVPKFEYHTNRMEKTEICLNFLDKRCTWGDRCHRIHPLPNIEVSRSLFIVSPRYMNFFVRQTLLLQYSTSISMLRP